MKTLAQTLFSCSQACNIVELSSDGLITHANQHFLTFSGYSTSEIIGKPYHTLLVSTPSHDFLNEMQTTLASGLVWQGEVAIYTKQGEAWIFSLILPSIDENGHLIKSYAFLNALNKLHEIEQENSQLQQQLLNAQRVENIGQLTSGIAHDFNNILMAITGFNLLGITFIKQQQYEKGLDALDKVAKAAARASDVISKMLTYCHQDVTPNATTPIDPAAVIDEVCNSASMLRATISTQIRLAFNNNLPHQNIGVLIDASALHQIVTNLIINAKDAIEENAQQSGQISVDLFVETLDAAELCLVCSQFISGTYLNLSITDTGIGISEEQMKRIFDPFYSTKGKGQGSGLGLSMVSGMVHQAGGHLLVNSVLGKGTTFTLLFPIVALVDTSTTSNPPQNDTPKRPANLKLCVVDDEADILALYKVQFSLLGYEVTPFNSALTAWTQINQTPDYFDAIITDYAMPKASGLELAKLVLGIRPQKPIIICTGYSDQLQGTKDLPQGNVFLIKKPIRIQQLDDILNRIW